MTELSFWRVIWDVRDVIGFKEGSEGRRLLQGLSSDLDNLVAMVKSIYLYGSNDLHRKSYHLQTLMRKQSRIIIVLFILYYIMLHYIIILYILNHDFYHQSLPSLI